MDSTKSRQKIDTLPKVGNAKITFLILLAIAMGGVNSFLTLVVGVNTIRVANKPTPNLVETRSGEAISVKAVDPKTRQEETIKEFTKQVMTRLFTWDGIIPPRTPEEYRNPAKDPGVEIKNSQNQTIGRVATATYEASMALSPKFREELLLTLAETTAPGVFEQKKEIVLIIRRLGTPQKIASGKWSIEMIADLIEVTPGNNLGEVIPFNKKIELQTVEKPKYQEYDSLFAKSIAKTRQAGLEITHFQELELK